MSKYIIIASMIFLIYFPLVRRETQAPLGEKKEEINREIPSAQDSTAMKTDFSGA